MPLSGGNTNSSECAHYFTFSQTRVFWLILPSPEKRAGGDVYTSRSPSLVMSRTSVVPVNTSFQEISM